jgi:hypothetical protein
MKSRKAQNLEAALRWAAVLIFLGSLWSDASGWVNFNFGHWVVIVVVCCLLMCSEVRDRRSL